jgi:hypothetical protein
MSHRPCEIGPQNNGGRTQRNFADSYARLAPFAAFGDPGAQSACLRAVSIPARANDRESQQARSEEKRAEQDCNHLEIPLPLTTLWAECG